MRRFVVALAVVISLGLGVVAGPFRDAASAPSGNAGCTGPTVVLVSPAFGGRLLGVMLMAEAQNDAGHAEVISQGAISGCVP